VTLASVVVPTRAVRQRLKPPAVTATSVSAVITPSPQWLIRLILGNDRLPPRPIRVVWCIAKVSVFMRRSFRGGCILLARVAS
jgi:hypothetical protein